MVKLMEAGNGQVFECAECGLRYRDQRIAQRCEDWCKRFDSCNLEITSNSIERIAHDEPGDLQMG